MLMAMFVPEIELILPLLMRSPIRCEALRTSSLEIDDRNYKFPLYKCQYHKEFVSFTEPNALLITWSPVLVTSC